MNDKKFSQLSNTQRYEIVKNLLLRADDTTMAYCVLGPKYEQFLENEKKFNKRFYKHTDLLIESMGNLLTLAGLFLHAKFNAWRATPPCTDEDLPNALLLKRLLSGLENAENYFCKNASSGLRVLRVLDSLYDNIDMNFLVIKYIIINSQIEAGYNLKKGLSSLIGFPHQESFRVSYDLSEKEIGNNTICNLAAAFNFVSMYRSDPVLENTLDSDKYMQAPFAFGCVVDAMDFMKHVKLKIDTGKISFIEDEKEYPSYGEMVVFEKKDEQIQFFNSQDLQNGVGVKIYFLEKIEYLQQKNNRTNAAVRLLYKSFDECDSKIIGYIENETFMLENCNLVVGLSEMSAVDYYKKVCGYLPGTRAASTFYHGMITMHYRYHNILAQAIVDAIDCDMDAKKRILKEFVKRNPIPFMETIEPIFLIFEHEFDKKFSDSWKEKIDELCEYISVEECELIPKYDLRNVIDWDRVVAKVLMYDGLSEIVKTILSNESGQYSFKGTNDITNFCSEIVAGLEMRYRDEIFNAKDVLSTQDEIHKTYMAKIKPTLVPGICGDKIKGKALAQSYIDAILYTFTKDKKNNDFAENNIQDILDIFKTHKDKKDSPYVEKAFLRAIKVYLSFYEGISECCQEWMQYELKKSASILSIAHKSEQATTQVDRTNIQKDFLKGVSKKAKELSGLFQEENPVKIALIELYNFAKSSQKKRHYFYLLAREPINQTKLEKIFKIDNENNVYFRGDDGGNIPLENMNIIRKYEYLEKIVKFLNGSDSSDVNDNEPDKYDHNRYKEYAQKVIYPQIVTVVQKRKDSDGNECLIMGHNGAFAYWHDREIQIFTEFDYEINTSYYTLPNLNSMETEWWVNPILIPCSTFDEKVREAI